MQHLTNIDLNKNQLLQAVIEVLATPPATPSEGQIYYNSTDQTAYIRLSGSWLDLGSTGTDSLGPDGDKGDITVGGTGTTLTIDIDAVTYAKMQNIVTANTLLGSLSADGIITELTKTQVLGLLNVADGAEVNVNTDIAESTKTATTVLVTSSTGNNATLTEANTTQAGVLSAAKWNEIAANTAKNTNVPTELSIGTVSGTTYGITSDGSVDDVIIAQAVASGNAGVMSGADKAKLDGIEALADVTDSTNVDAAGAVMNSDTTTVDMSFVIDEDNMVSDLDTKVPTQQSVKAYVDSAVSSALYYKGAYDASVAPPTGAGILTGFMYTVTVAGDGAGFFAETLQIGDVIISEIDNPIADADWTKVNKNIPDIVSASETEEGIIKLATQAEVDTGTDAVKAVTPATLSSFTASQKYAANIGDNSNTSFTITAATHGLGTSGDFIVQVREVSSGDLVVTDISLNATTGLVTITFNVAPTTNQYRVVIK